MRTLAARLGVVPGALYHHVRTKEQLQDLVLDAALAEVDGHLDPSQPWTQQLKLLAHRLREVLENHPGVAALLKTRDPLGPHSLALAEAILAPEPPNPSARSSGPTRSRTSTQNSCLACMRHLPNWTSRSGQHPALHRLAEPQCSQ
jgi:AcrR family transcriptional regulator